jgi:hypothetical protein
VEGGELLVDLAHGLGGLLGGVGVSGVRRVAESYHGKRGEREAGQVSFEEMGDGQ